MGKKQKLAFACTCACLGGLFTFFLFLERDFFVNWDWTKPEGKFLLEPDAKLQAAARDFAESQHPGKVCVGQWIGKDEKFLYMAIGCATFKEHLGEIRVQGDANFTPVRLRYAGEQVTDIERPAPETFANGLRRLFPREAGNLLQAHLSVGDFHKLGLARMQERGLSTMGE